MAIDLNRGSANTYLPAAVSTEIWSSTIDASAVMAAARQVPLPGGGVTVPMITTDAEASWTDETDEKDVSRPTLGNKTMRPYTLSVIVPFSNQFKRDLGSLYAEMVRRLPLALGKKFDETVFGAVTAPGSDFDQLDGAPTATVDATGTFGDLGAVVNTIAAAGADLTAWVASPTLYGQLLVSTDALGRQFFSTDPGGSRSVGSVFGAPVYKSRADMDGGTGFAGDWANSAVWGSVEGVQVATSDQATLKDGATTINLWQRNMFAVRCEVELGFRVRSDQHFVKIEGTSTP